MVYNTQLPKMIIPEYGRNIQKLVEHVCSLKNKEVRSQMAHAIISVMERLNPQLRDITDFRHKLWDHLHIISDFKLSVDSPYPKPNKEIFDEKPERVKYPSSGIRIRHYGIAIERIIEKVSEMKEGEEKTAHVNALANLMKKFYLTWNRQSVNDHVILEELQLLSNGKLKVSENFQMNSTNDILARTRSINTRNDRDRGRRGKRSHDRRHRQRRGR